MNQIPLPPEILKLIFSYLTQKDLMDGVRFVCKQWYNTAHVEAIVIFPFTREVYRELLNDFTKNPVFAANVKQLTLKEDDEYISCKDELSTQYYALNSVFEYCPNLKAVKVHGCCSKTLLDHLDQMQKAVASKTILKLECVELIDFRPTLDVEDELRAFIIHRDHSKLQININQVIKNLGPELRRFAVLYKEMDSISDEEEIQLKSLEIDCKTSVISKESLLQLTSNNGFSSNLEVLKLNLIMEDFPNDDPEYEELRDKLEKYCESSLKVFNIYIRRNHNNKQKRIVLLDNCTDQKESYIYKEYIEDNLDYEDRYSDDYYDDD